MSFRIAMKIDLWMLALGTFAAGTDLLVIAGILPSMANELSVSVSAAGLLVTAFAVTYAIASPILTTITSAMNRRYLLIGALGFFSLGNALSALSPTYYFLIISRIITGIGASLYTPTAYATASLLVPQESRGKALSIVVSGFTISTVIGVPLGSFVGEAFGWRMTFWLVAALGLASLIVLVAVFPSLSGSKYLGFKARISPILKRSIAFSLATIALWAVSTWSIYTFIAPLLNHYIGVSDYLISSILLIVGLGSVVGNALGGYASDRFGPLSASNVSLILRSILFVSMPFVSTSLIGASADLLFWGLLSWMFFVPQQSRLLSLAPESSSIALSLNNSFLYAGGAIGSALGGLVLDNFSFTGLIVVAVVFNVLSLAVQLASKRAVDKGVLGSQSLTAQHDRVIISK